MLQLGKTPRDAGTGADIWRSSDSGGTWVREIELGGQNEAWLSVATNEDGSAVVACSTQTNSGVPPGGRIWRSLNSGVNWSESTPTFNKPWRAVTSSYDGSPTANAKFAVTAYGENIWTSIDSGSNWVEQTGFAGSPDPSLNWWGIASNSTGSNLAACGRRRQHLDFHRQRNELGRTNRFCWFPDSKSRLEGHHIELYWVYPHCRGRRWKHLEIY